MTMIRPRSVVVYGICRGLPSELRDEVRIDRGLPSARLILDLRLIYRLEKNLKIESIFKQSFIYTLLYLHPSFDFDISNCPRHALI